MKKLQPVESHSRSQQDKFVDSLFLLVVVGFFMWVVDKLMDFLFLPLEAVDSNMADAREHEDMAKRIARREARMAKFDSDESDPMHQFQLRFITHNKEYKKDPANDSFLNWYKQWQDGKIVDTYLRWAPPMMEEERMSAKFLAYLNIQINLHKKESFLRKNLFLSNIRSCYPEFTPSFSGLRQDVAAYSAEISEEDLSKELEEELIAFGINEQVAKHIAGSPNPKKFMEDMDYVKGICDSCDPYVAIFMIDNEIKPGTLKAELAGHVLKTLKLPHAFATAYILGEIGDEDLREIKEAYESMKGWVGMNMYRKNEEGKYLCDEIAQELIATHMANGRAKKVSAVCSKK